MKEWNIHFADSLILFRNLIKEKHAGLKQEALYKHLFGTDFQGHDALEDVKALSKILFKVQLTPNFFFRKKKTSNCNDTFGEKNYVIDEILAILQFFKVEVPLSHDRTFVGSGTNLFRDVIEGIALPRLIKHMIKKLF